MTCSLSLYSIVNMPTMVVIIFGSRYYWLCFVMVSYNYILILFLCVIVNQCWKKYKSKFKKRQATLWKCNYQYLIIWKRWNETNSKLFYYLRLNLAMFQIINNSISNYNIYYYNVLFLGIYLYLHIIATQTVKVLCTCSVYIET